MVTVAALLAAFVLGDAATARAYRTGSDLAILAETTRVRWASPVVDYRLHDRPPPGITYVALEDAVRAAAQAWNAVPCAAAELRFGGRTRTAAGPMDGVVTIQWIRSGWADRGLATDAAATTDLRYIEEAGQWRIAEADVYLNADRFSWSLTESEGGLRDVQAVVTHELGHVLGLLHPCETSGADGAPACDPSHEGTAMHPVYAPTQRYLAGDDIDGACFLYSQETVCEAGSCPAGYECSPSGCIPTCVGSGCDCDPLLGCTRGVCVEGSCEVPPGHVGDPCATSSDCAASACATAGYCATTCSEGCTEGYECEDGLCLATAGVYGDPCTRGSDCASGLCVSGNRFDGICTRGCDGLSCPAGDVCMLVGGRAVCRPPMKSSQGCSVGVRRPTGSGMAWLVVVWMMLVGRRRFG